FGAAALTAALAFGQAPSTAPAKPQGETRTPSLRELSGVFEALTARVRPAVVQIFSTGYAPIEAGENGTNTGSLLSKQRSTGTGVTLSQDGYIVTNNHVVEGARKIEVKLPMRGRTRGMGMTVEAKLIGVDRETDLALIKIERSGLPVLALGDSDRLRQ